MDDGSFYFEPELSSGVFARAARTGLEYLAERARLALDAEVTALLDLTSDIAEVAVQGAFMECTDDKETVLMAWLQEVTALTMRRTPPKLALVFGCLDVLVVPVRSPARLVGMLAFSTPVGEQRPIRRLALIAGDLALELESAERRGVSLARHVGEARTEPAPPLFEHVA